MEQNSSPEYAAYPRATADPRQYYGPPDFRVEAINEAWLMLKGDWTTWIVSVLLVGVITVIMQAPSQFYTMWKAMSDGPAAAKSLDVALIGFLCSCASTLVAGALMGGIYRVALQRMRLVYEGVGGIFNLQGQGWKVGGWTVLMSLPTLLVTLVYTLAAPQIEPGQSMPDLGAVFLPLILYMGFIMLISLIMFPFFLAPLLIIDQRLGVFEAAGKSWRTVTQKYFRALGFYVVAGLVAVSGVIACGIGVLVTAPLMYLMIAIAYRDHFMPPLSTPQPGPAINYFPEGPSSQPPG